MVLTFYELALEKIPPTFVKLNSKSTTCTMASSKRPHSPDAFGPLPEADLTADRLEEWLKLSDRQKSCWALQTETRVRFDKVHNRENFQVSTSLQDGNYLFQVYPQGTSTVPGHLTTYERDRTDFARQSAEFLSKVRETDFSWDSLTPLSVDYNEGFEKSVGSEFQPRSVPPNFLYFRLILEGYMGYTWARYHSGDTSHPRAAVMGGSVVSALTAWRDAGIVKLFEVANLPIFFSSNAQNAVQADYVAKRNDLVRKVNMHFLYKEDKSSFSDGDVDIFLQPSPVTRSILRYLSNHGLHSQVISSIFEFIGGLDVVQSDLERAVKATLATMRVKETKESGFVYALTHNGISMQYAFTANDDEDEIDNWPRTTQVIMLKPYADLLGGLMDFDISTVSVAFDGINVFATPRAALSLLTMTQVVTPFILLEDRNRRRIMKYSKRGFGAYMIDPYCTHSTQCCSLDRSALTIKKGSCRFSLSRSENPNRFIYPRMDPWLEKGVPESDSQDLDSRGPRATMRIAGQPTTFVRDRFAPEEIDDIYAYQAENIDECLICCCEDHFETPATYTILLFEHEEGDAFKFFKKLHSWSSEWETQVNEIDVKCRFACKPCRFAYAMSKVAKAAEDVIDPKNDEFLRDEPACHCWAQYNPKAGLNSSFSGCEDWFSFYCGPTFDSRLARASRTVYEELSALQAKANMELARYIVKHGEAAGYIPRFVFSSSLDDLFDRVSDLTLAKPSRAPVGLNPERFIARCVGCNGWLLGYEYSVELCELCINR